MFTHDSISQVWTLPYSYQTNHGLVAFSPNKYTDQIQEMLLTTPTDWQLSVQQPSITQPIQNPPTQMKHQ